MKERITISVEKKLLKALDKKVDDFIFASRSHGFEALIADEIKKEKTPKKTKERIKRIEYVL